MLDSFSADVRAYVENVPRAGNRMGRVEIRRSLFARLVPSLSRGAAPASKMDRGGPSVAACLRKRDASRSLPGARKVLRILGRKFRLGIVTSGSRTRVRQQLRSFELAQYFSACVCGEDASRRKPHPAPIQLAMKRMRASPEETIYIGDSAEDVEMARSAGVRSIGVLGPFPTEKRMRAAEPELLLRSIQDLPRYLQASAKKRIGPEHD